MSFEATETSISGGGVSLSLSSDLMLSGTRPDFPAGNPPFCILAVLLCHEASVSARCPGEKWSGARRPPRGPGLSVPSPPKECRWRELEEHRQAERLQRQLQQEQAYLLSLQHDPRRPPPPPDRSKAGLHEPKAQHEPADRAREVRRPSSCALPRGWWAVRGREGPLLCLVLSREDPSASLTVPSHLNTDLDGRQHSSVPVHGGRVACSAVFPELPSG